MSILHELIAPKDDADDVFLVREIYFNDGDKVLKDTELIDLETSKTVVSIDSPVDGFVEYIVELGNTINVGELVLRIHDKPDSIVKKNQDFTSTLSSNKTSDNQRVSKKAQEYIDKHNVDISAISKSFISLSDILDNNLPKSISTDRSSQESSSIDILSPLDAELSVEKRQIKLAKKIEIAALSEVNSPGLVSTIFYNLDDCNFPESKNLIINSAGSYLPIIALEVSKLLRKYPMLNSYYDNHHIMEYADINIGIALDIDDGLKVYTIKNSDKLNLESIEYEISQGIYSYFRKTLTSRDIKGSTFTITDLSSLGVDRFVPLINYKQSAILGVSSIDDKHNRLTLSMSFDHRVTEGRAVANFLSELSNNLHKHN